ncbi:MAG: hypothetical protein CMJ64_10140 [Planctomycetaceae bacterium]|nr:hypothetical protein [Planctomycetaceae bacterium]
MGARRDFLMRCLLNSLGLLVCSFITNTLAVEIPPEQHPWGRFQPDSWSRVRVVSETFGGGKSSSEITIITTTLVSVEEDGVVLTRETKTGDEEAREENVKYDWDGSKSDPKTQEKYSLGEVDVDGKTYACQTHIRTTKDGFGDRYVKSWYSPDQSPYFLKQLTRLSGKSPETTSMRVLRLAVTQTVLDKPVVCWQSETRLSGLSDKSMTTSYHSMDVPGGLVSSEAEVLHPQQGTKRRIRRELIEYEAIR